MVARLGSKHPEASWRRDSLKGCLALSEHSRTWGSLPAAEAMLDIGLSANDAMASSLYRLRILSISSGHASLRREARVLAFSVAEILHSNAFSRYDYDGCSIHVSG